LTGGTWQESGKVFTNPDGSALHPDWVTRRFGLLVKDSGLPPVRLHDLRHGAATLAHAARADLKTRRGSPHQSSCRRRHPQPTVA
jgi:integrase